jgi:hypothetical protein
VLAACFIIARIFEMDDIKLIGVYSADIDALQAGISSLRNQLMVSDPDGSFNKHMEYMLENARLSQRLTATEQRNAESSAAPQLATRLLASGLSALNPRAGLAKNVRAFLESQRKPTESGASE